MVLGEAPGVEHGRGQGAGPDPFARLAVGRDRGRAQTVTELDERAALREAVVDPAALGVAGEGPALALHELDLGLGSDAPGLQRRNERGLKEAPDLGDFRFSPVDVGYGE